MEAEPYKRRLRAPNPLYDCTNTISSTTTTTLATAASSQSSFAFTVKLKFQNPKLAFVTGNLFSALDPKPSVVLPPIPSIPPRPHPVLSSTSDVNSWWSRNLQILCIAKADYKVRQEIDFFGEISDVSMSPGESGTEPSGEKNLQDEELRVAKGPSAPAIAPQPYNRSAQTSLEWNYTPQPAVEQSNYAQSFVPESGAEATEEAYAVEEEGELLKSM